MACAVMFFLVGLVTSASAQNIAVAKFEGDNGTALEKDLIKMLSQYVKVVTPAEFAAEVEKMGNFDGSPESIVKLAKKLQATAIVGGAVQKKGKKVEVVVVVFDGASGQLAGKEMTFSLRKAKFKEDNLKEILLRLDQVFQASAPPAGATPDKTTKPGAAKSGAAESAKPEDEKSDDEKSGEENSDEENSANDEDDEDDDEEKESKRAPLNREMPVDVSAGFSFISRDLSFSTKAGVSNKPQGYNGGLAPNLRIAGEIYPLAFKDKHPGWKRNVGIGVSLDQSLFLKSSPDTNSSVKLDTTQRRLALYAVYRINLKKAKPIGPTLKLMLGLSQTLFDIAKEDAPMDLGPIDIPNVSFVSFSPGATFRYPMGESIALNAELKGHLVSSMGEVTTQDLYGDGSAWGFEVGASGEYRLSERLLLRVGGMLARYSLSFEGNGVLANRDADNDPDVLGATDQYLGIYALAGYVF